MRARKSSTVGRTIRRARGMRAVGQWPIRTTGRPVRAASRETAWVSRLQLSWWTSRYSWSSTASEARPRQ